MTKDNESNFIADILRHWPILITFAGGFIAWGMLSNRLTVAEADIKALQVKQQTIDTTMGDVRETLTEIKTSLVFIKEKLDKQN